MESYCFNENVSVKNIKQSRLIFLSNCAVCGKKNQDSFKFKNSVLFTNFSYVWNDYLKMNKTVNKFLLDEDKIMPKLHLRKPGFNYSSFASFTEHRERIQKFEETYDLKHTC